MTDQCGRRLLSQPIRRSLARPSSESLRVLITFDDGVARRRVTVDGQRWWLAPAAFRWERSWQFRSQFRVQVFEKLSGRPDLNRRPLDPQEVGLASVQVSPAVQGSAGCAHVRVVHSRAYRVVPKWSQALAVNEPPRDLLGVNSLHGGR